MPNEMTYYYLNLLKRELDRRTARNQKYSIRAFARDLKIDHGTMAGVISGRRPPSKNLAQSLCVLLKLSAEESQLFLASATERRHRQTIEKSRRRHASALSGKKEIKARVIPPVEYPLFSEWYSTVILELTFIEGFQSDPAWIARRLGISKDLVEQKISEFIGAGYLRHDGERLTKTSLSLGTWHRDQTTAELRERQRQVLNHAARSIDEVSIGRRSQISMTMAIDPDKVPIARQMISEFLDTLCALLESGRRRNVYECSITFFPWDKVDGEAP